MIKDINDIASMPAAFKRDFFSNCSVSEKIDTHYVSIEVLKNGKLKFLKSNGKEITQKDMILSKQLFDFVSDWRYLSYRLKNDNIFKPGLKVFFFYFPCEKPLSIDYSRHFAKCGDENKVNASYVITNAVYNNESYNLVEALAFAIDLEECDFDNCVMEDSTALFFIDSPNTDSNRIIMLSNHERLLKDSNPDIDNIVNAEKITPEIISCILGQDCTLLNKISYRDAKIGDDYQGIILKHHHAVYQLSSEKELHREPKMTNRSSFEFVLKEYIDFFKNEDDIVDILVNSDYVQAVNTLFLKFMKDPARLEKIRANVESKDLLPPGYRDFDDMSYGLINDQDVESIIKKDELAKNAYKILLANLDRYKNASYCVLLSKDQVDFWNYVVNLMKSPY